MSRERTRAVLAHLQAAGHIRPHAPRPAKPKHFAHPSAIEIAYFHAIEPVIVAARDAAMTAWPAIHQALRESRVRTGMFDAQPLGVPDVEDYPGLSEALKKILRGTGATLRPYEWTAVGHAWCVDLPGDPYLVIASGLDGTQQAGPRMLARKLDRLVRRAKQSGLGLRIYPCVNPIGYHHRQGASDGAAVLTDLAWWAKEHQTALVLELGEHTALRAGYSLGALHSGPRADLAAMVVRSGIPLDSRRVRGGGKTGTDGILPGAASRGSLASWAGRVGLPRSFMMYATAGNEDAAADQHWATVCAAAEYMAKSQRKDADDPADTLRRAAGRFAAQFRPEAMHQVVEDFGRRADRLQRAQLDEQLRRAIGVSYYAIEAHIRDQVPAWAQQNVALIKTLPERYFDRLSSDVADAFAEGSHPDSLAEEWSDRYDQSLDDSMRIARDQIGKLQSDVNEARQEALGVDEFEWVTMHDNRVCVQCDELDGEVFSWDDPPDGITPGQCHPLDRCYAAPQLDGLIDRLTGGDEDTQPDEDATAAG